MAGRRVAEIVRRRLGVRGSVTAIVKAFAETAPAPAWDQILALDFGSDTAALVAWFESLLGEEPPEPKIIDEVGPSRIVADREALAIAAGHDSGDALLLGGLRATGLDDSRFGRV